MTRQFRQSSNAKMWFRRLCPEFDIASQGDSIEEARANLQEALRLFFETASPEEISQRRGLQ